jgi:hypothetical protein
LREKPNLPILAVMAHIGAEGGPVTQLIMQTTEITHRFAALEESKKSDDYNFEHFRTRTLLRDAERSLEARGVKPGEIAPDFELPKVGVGSLRLSELRGRPVVLHFGSFS